MKITQMVIMTRAIRYIDSAKYNNHDEDKLFEDVQRMKRLYIDNIARIKKGYDIIEPTIYSTLVPNGAFIRKMIKYCWSEETTVINRITFEEYPTENNMRSRLIIMFDNNIIKYGWCYYHMYGFNESINIDIISHILINGPFFLNNTYAQFQTISYDNVKQKFNKLITDNNLINKMIYITFVLYELVTQDRLVCDMIDAIVNNLIKTI